jgi:predicted nucleotide-binding protein (sugar kinase/HSP70/actin superfamily)
MSYLLKFGEWKALFEQTGTSAEPIVSAKIVFAPGLYKITDAQGLDTLDTQLNNLKAKLAQRKDKNYITKIALSAGESQIPNQEEFKEKGSLARKRMEIVETHLKELGIPQINISKKLTIGTTPYVDGDLNDQNSEKMKLFTSEQFFSVEVTIEELTTAFIRDFVIMKYAYDSGNANLVARWATTTFEGTHGVNNIIDQKNYDYLTSNLENEKLYTPENLYKIIVNNLGGENSSTFEHWPKIGITPGRGDMKYRVKIFSIKQGQDEVLVKQYMNQKNQEMSVPKPSSTTPAIV